MHPDSIEPRSRKRGKPRRWVLSISVAIGSVSLALALQTVAPESISFSQRPVSADTTNAVDGVDVGFSDETGQLINSLVLELPAGEQDAYLTAAGLAPGLHDTVQILLRHNPSVTEIVSMSCAGLFEGAFSPLDPIELSPGELLFSCSLNGGVMSGLRLGGVQVRGRLSLRNVSLPAGPADCGQRAQILPAGRTYHGETSYPPRHVRIGIF